MIFLHFCLLPKSGKEPKNTTNYMKSFKLLTIFILLFAITSPQYVVAEDAEVDANIITSDANEHYLTIDYSKYNNFETKNVGSGPLQSNELKNIHNLDNGNLDITFNYPCYKVDFQISTYWLFSWGDANIYVDETYNDNGSWDDTKNIFGEKGIKGHYIKKYTTISHTDKIAKKIAFKKDGGSSSGKYVHDIKLYIAPHIIFSSPTSFDFETTKVGECTSYQTIEFYSFLSEGELVIEKPTNFIISSINGQTPTLSGDTYHIANNNTLRYIGETNEQKKYNIVIGFQPTTTGKITETINIKDSKNQKQKQITLNGEGFDKQPQIITWNQSLSSLQVGNTVTLDATASSGLPVTYSSSNSSIVSINGNQLTANTNGTATITATVEGNDLYAPATLKKYAKVGNGNINNCSGNITLATNNGGSGENFSYSFKNLPPIKNKKIKFNYTIAKKTGIFSSNTSFSVSISNNRDNQTLGFSQSNDDRKNPITGSKEYTFEKEDITELTITMESNQSGSAISNIIVELPTTLYTDITNITFPQTPINETSSKPLKISFAQLKDNIDISISGTDANHFSINKSYISAGCGKWGLETINIYFSPNSYKEENYNATLIIKSEGQTNIEIPLVGSTIYRETTFNKDGNWNDPMNWSGGVPTGIGKNAIINANAIIPDNYTAIVNNITIANGGSITITPKGKLKANNINGATTENLTLQANENGSAILLFKNDENNKVNATIQLYSLASSDGLRNGQAGNFKDPKWQYLGIATENIEYSTLNPNGTSNWIYRWDETQNATSCWAEKLTSNSTLSAWNGYCLAQESATTYSYTGTLLNADHTYNLTYTPENASDDLGNNLITNSYTAPIDITTLNDANFQNAKANIYIYKTGSYLEWKEQTTSEGFNAGQVIVIPVNTISILGNEYPRTIASMQAFFVNATAKEASFSINYENNVYNSLRKENQKRSKSFNSDNKFNVLKIQINSSTSNDRLYLLEHENTTDKFDNGYDAEKIFDNTNGPQIYATTPFGHASICSNTSFDGQEIGFIANSENEIYTMTFDIENLHSYEELYIYDTETKTHIDIISGESYQFYASTTPNNKRFQITSTRLDAPQGPTTTIENTTTWNEILQEKQPIYIYSITGQLIATYNSKFYLQSLQELRSQLAVGVYIVKSGNKTMKIIIENR